MVENLETIEKTYSKVGIYSALCFWVFVFGAGLFGFAAGASLALGLPFEALTYLLCAFFCAVLALAMRSKEFFKQSVGFPDKREGI